MAHTEQHYRDAAQGLKGELGSTFGKSSLNDAAVSNIHRIANFKDNAELMGLKGGSVSGIQKRGESLARTVNESQSAQDEKSKKSFDNVLFLNLLDQHIADLDRRMGEIEQKLIEQFGEEWAEQLALEILEPDEIPERREDESMSEYRASLKQRLVDEVRNEDGSIKPEYRDNPKYAHLIEMAETQTRQDKALEMRAIEDDPSYSDEQKTALREQYLENEDFEGKFEYQLEVERGSEQDIAANESMDIEKDTKLTQGVTSNLDNAFLS